MWGFITATILELGHAFVIAEGYIKQFVLPKQVYLLRTLIAAAAVLLIGLAVLFVLLLVLGSLDLLGWLCAVPGMVLLLAAGLGHISLFAYLGVRFAELPHALGGFLQLLFFMTPILFPANSSGIAASVSSIGSTRSTTSSRACARRYSTVHLPASTCTSSLRSTSSVIFAGLSDGAEAGPDARVPSMSKVSITLDDVSLHFSGRAGNNSLKTWIAGRLRPADERAQDYVVKALQNISLRIDEGERVGLVGLNGAGKTTLLKVMAGIYPTTSGSAHTVGHVCPLFEFATGFEMHQTGYDNIRIRGLLLGMTHAQIDRKMPEIAAFTELGAFLDYPVKTYSAGMFIRLAFAVSTSINPEVLLIDEVMGAGDQRFAERARNRMLEFMREGKVLVFSSHSMELLKSFCSRTIWLERGRIAMDGPTDEVIAAYRDSEGSTAAA